MDGWDCICALPFFGGEQQHCIGSDVQQRRVKIPTVTKKPNKFKFEISPAHLYRVVVGSACVTEVSNIVAVGECI